MARQKRSGAEDDTLQPTLFGALRPPPEPARLEAPGKGSPGRRTSSRTEGEGEPLPLPDWSHVPPAPPGVYFGTSSWTYPSWSGQIFSRRYKGGTDSLAMLEEYVRCPLFGCVGVDSTFYRPPPREVLQAYHDILPPGFHALGKVYDRLTIRRFANDKRWGELAGELNPDFLNPHFCIDEVVGPWLEMLGDRAGPLLFEFQTMYPPHRPRAEAFAEELARFFEQLPKEGRYAVELRNPEFLHSAYFDALRSVGVAHLFNAWTRMPTIGEQLNLPGSLTADFVVVRALLMKGRSYDEAVDSFKPFDRLQEVQPEARRDIVQLIEEALEQGVRVYVLVNNRLEGNSPLTIAGLRQMLAERRGGPNP